MANELLRGIGGAVAAIALTLGPTTLIALTAAPMAQADGCYNGVTRLNPYGRSCTLPGPVNKIRGSAPDANAIIACKGIPGCLSYYVNNP